jgi:hypothetical protein
MLGADLPIEHWVVNSQDRFHMACVTSITETQRAASILEQSAQLGR